MVQGLGCSFKILVVVEVGAVSQTQVRIQTLTPTVWTCSRAVSGKLYHSIHSSPSGPSSDQIAVPVYTTKNLHTSKHQGLS